MFQFRIPYLISGSLLSVLISCTPVHKQMKQVTGMQNSLQKFVPDFNVALYNTKVDVAGKHLSGLLIIKKMPDSSRRLVFSNEMGFTFFDFEFTADGDFKVHSVIKQMNKKAVLKTLRKDFELILMLNINFDEMEIRQFENNLYFIFPREKGYDYYITDSEAQTLLRMERASRKKIIVEAVIINDADAVPDSIGISHKGFEFNIGLKKIHR